MEARGEIPPPGSLPAGHIRVIVHRIISPPNGERNWEGVAREERERWLAAYDRNELEAFQPNLTRAEADLRIAMLTAKLKLLDGPPHTL